MTKRRSRFDTESIIDYAPMAPSLPMQSPAIGRRELPQGAIGRRESDVTVPVLQSLAVSLAYASLAGVLVASITLAFRLRWYYPVVAGALTFTATVSWTMTKNVSLRQELWWGTEEIVHRDLGGDGTIGEPEPEMLLRVEVVDDSSTHFLDVPRKKAVVFAKAVTDGQSGISEGKWKRFFGGIDEFKAFRGQLLDSGLVRWKSPDAHAQGITLTLAGRQVLKRLANLSPTENG